LVPGVRVGLNFGATVPALPFFQKGQLHQFFFSLSGSISLLCTGSATQGEKEKIELPCLACELSWLP
jgi:hypothetical protein